jgi:hypothetical protein
MKRGGHRNQVGEVLGRVLEVPRAHFTLAHFGIVRSERLYIF